MEFINFTKYFTSSTKDAQFKGARQLEEVSESNMKFLMKNWMNSKLTRNKSKKK